MLLAVDCHMFLRTCKSVCDNAGSARNLKLWMLRKLPLTVRSIRYRIIQNPSGLDYIAPGLKYLRLSSVFRGMLDLSVKKLSKVHALHLGETKLMSMKGISSAESIRIIHGGLRGPHVPELPPNTEVVILPRLYTGSLKGWLSHNVISLTINEYFQKSMKALRDTHLLHLDVSKCIFCNEIKLGPYVLPNTLVLLVVNSRLVWKKEWIPKGCTVEVV